MMSDTQPPPLKAYSQVIQRLIDGDEQLPSLPSITLKIRQAVRNPDVTVQEVAKLLQLDPSLSALVIKYASSPIYRRSVPPKTIETAVSIMGIPAVDNLVMLHSIKSLFTVKSSQLKMLYKNTWKRMLHKAATSQLIAKKVGYKPPEAAMTTCILTEIGTLALLSSFNQLPKTPDEKTYRLLCRKYSKALSRLILQKWEISPQLLFISQKAGEWEYKKQDKFTILDIVNLAIYSTVIYQNPKNDLPPIDTVISYQKLTNSFKELDDNQQLKMVSDNFSEITDITASLL